MPTPVQRGLASRSHLPLVLGTNRSDPVAVRLEPLLAGRLPLGHGPGALLPCSLSASARVRHASTAREKGERSGKASGGGKNQRTGW